jgi:hypothetical protein
LNLTDSRGNPASAVDIAFVTKAAIGLKPVNVATTDPQGAATVFLNTFANVSKREKVQVQVRVCKDGKYTVILVQPGATLKKDENCDDKPAGLIPWGSGVRVTLNITTATLTVSGGGGLGTGTTVLLVAGGAGLLGGTLAVLNGNKSNTTGGANVTPGNANNPSPPSQSYAPFFRMYGITIMITTKNSVRDCLVLGDGGSGTLKLDGNAVDGSGFKGVINGANLPMPVTMTGTIAINGTYKLMAALGGGDKVDMDGQATVSGSNATTSGTIGIVAGPCTASGNYSGQAQ